MQPQKVTFPATSQELIHAGWRLTFSRNCKLCGVPIDFWWTGKKYAPLERDKEPPHKLRSHFETCPHAAQFRKPDTQGDLFK